MKEYAAIETHICLLLLVAGALLIFFGCRSGWKYMVQKKRCTDKTDGIVVGYSRRGYGGEGSCIHLPVVEYTVLQKQYRIIGPEYRAYVTKTTRLKAEKGAEHEYTTEVRNQVFRESIRKSGFLDTVGNPMEKLFPQGSLIPVYYDPEKPKLAYVLRYCNCCYIFWMGLLTGLLLLGIDLFLIIF